MRYAQRDRLSYSRGAHKPPATPCRRGLRLRRMALVANVPGCPNSRKSKRPAAVSRPTSRAGASCGSTYTTRACAGRFPPISTRGDQARADGQSRSNRRREHLRQRSAVPRGHPSGDAREPVVQGAPRSAGRRGPRRAAGGDREGGSTLRDYVGSDGASGYFQLEYFVYGRVGAACRVCTHPVRHRRQGGRSSFFCAQCQRR